MHKRGNVELLIVFSVLVVAALGLFFTFGIGKAVQSPQYVDSPASPLDLCMSNCYSSFTGDQQSSCLGGCVTLYSTQLPETYAESPTGRVELDVHRIRDAPKLSPLENCQNVCVLQFAGSALEACFADCNRYSSVGDPYAQSWVTGNFALPAAKEYGGEVRGVAISGTRAFPGGRAIELPEQSCFMCSCLSEGLTALDESTAQRVCFENCDGYIVSSSAGPCR